jgi:hypothetical protein
MDGHEYRFGIDPLSDQFIATIPAQYSTPYSLDLAGCLCIE